MLRVVVLAFALVQATEAFACTTPDFNTPISKFLVADHLGNLGFSEVHAPNRVQTVEFDGCVKLKRKPKNKRLYFFVNHRTNLSNENVTFLAIRVTKKFRTLRFDEFNTHGLRTGVWHKSGTNEVLTEVEEISPFIDLSPKEFVEIHKASPLDEAKLNDAFQSFSESWHGKPEGSRIASNQFISIWKSDQKFEPTMQIENYLIRFSTVPNGSRPAKNKRGIDFNIGIHDDLDEMIVEVASPFSQSFNHKFTIKNVERKKK